MLEPLLVRSEEAVFDAEGLAKVEVSATIVDHLRGKKLRVFKFKPKRGYRRRTGHRQELTRIEVTHIGAPAAQGAARRAAAEPRRRRWRGGAEGDDAPGRRGEAGDGPHERGRARDGRGREDARRPHGLPRDPSRRRRRSRTPPPQRSRPMAHKKGLGSSRNGRDSNAQRLGVKTFAGQQVSGGEIIVRQRGSRFKAGEGVGMGKDDTLYARAAGKVRFSVGRRGRVVSIDPGRVAARARRAARAATPPAAHPRQSGHALRQGAHPGPGRRRRQRAPRASAARRTCRAAGPTAATAATAATWCSSATPRCATCSRSAAARLYRAPRRRRGGRVAAPRRRGRAADPGGAARHAGAHRRRRPARPRPPRAARGRRARGIGRARQQALRDADAPGAALRRARSRRAGGDARADAQAARRRRPGRAAERRQVLAALAADARGAEDRRLPVHDARAGARHARGIGPPADRRRHPRPDRGRERRRRARPRLSRAHRTHAAARARARRRAA